MHVIITAPAIKEVLGDPKGPIEATYDGEFFIVNGVKVSTEECTPVFTKKTEAGITNNSQFKFQVSEQFKKALEFGKSQSSQALRLYEALVGANHGLTFDQYPVNYIDIDENGQVTYIDYLKAKAIELVGGDVWTNKNRSSCTPGTLFSKVFKSQSMNIFSSSQCEMFSNCFNSFTEFNKLVTKGLLDIVTGKDIVKYYLDDHYVSGSGTLNKSCMRNYGNSEQIKFYELNSSVCSMAVIYSDTSKNRIRARALVWTAVDGERHMDRIYSVDGVSEQLMKDYARHLGIPIVDRTENPQKAVKLEYVMHTRYPYMDTMRWLDIDGGYLFNDPKNKLANPDALASIQSTGGERSRTSYEVVCHVTSNYILRRDAVWCTIEGQYAHRDHAIVFPDGVSCFRKNAVTDAVSGKLILKEKAIRIEGIGLTCEISMDNVVFCHKNSSWIVREDARPCLYSSYYFHKDTMIEVDGGYVEENYYNKYKAARRFTYKENLILA